MGERDERLIWMDLEMTGLDPERERIIEISTIVTGYDLNIVAEGPELVIHVEDEILVSMDDWNRNHHGASGLIDRVKASNVTADDAERQTLDFLEEHCEQNACPLAGNTVHHDRRFLFNYMPKLAVFPHYRIVDVSSIKELVERWLPKIEAKRPVKKESHRARDDILESIAELKFYRDNAFVQPEPE